MVSPTSKRAIHRGDIKLYDSAEIEGWVELPYETKIGWGLYTKRKFEDIRESGHLRSR